ncbi:IS3 family transposase [Neobacillus soli]|uniref:IS3 family transposase n=1 Tax=Neobacillus soli TaxID=220688 RepID=UPI001F33AD64|nr:IS3 family transposase [Neobacillus soli]
MSKVRNEVMYCAIRELNENKNYPIQLLCTISKTNRSSYYKWLNRKETDQERENRGLLKEIKALYQKVDGIYGYRRITMNLNRKMNKHYNTKRIHRLMQLVGLQSRIRRKKKWDHRPSDNNVAENILNREFTAAHPNEKWVTDITELKYADGQKAYLSAILDLYDNSIVSFELGHRNDNQLVFKTIKGALVRNASHDDKLLVHSDRGFQYTSNGFKRIVEKNHLTQSMSRVGKCIDNGCMESFWGTLKVERYYLHRYQSFKELEKDIKKYIQFYNQDRLQAKFNGLSPIEYRTKAIA